MKNFLPQFQMHLEYLVLLDLEFLVFLEDLELLDHQFHQ
jgi:hypothetical protein